MKGGLQGVIKWDLLGGGIKQGKSRVIWGISGIFPIICLVWVGIFHDPCWFPDPRPFQNFQPAARFFEAFKDPQPELNLDLVKIKAGNMMQ